jgi:hypothetical protein
MNKIAAKQQPPKRYQPAGSPTQLRQRLRDRNVDEGNAEIPMPALPE